MVPIAQQKRASLVATGSGILTVPLRRLCWSRTNSDSPNFTKECTARFVCPTTGRVLLRRKSLQVLNWWTLGKHQYSRRAFIFAAAPNTNAMPEYWTISDASNNPVLVVQASTAEAA